MELCPRHALDVCANTAIPLSRRGTDRQLGADHPPGRNEAADVKLLPAYILGAHGNWRIPPVSPVKGPASRSSRRKSVGPALPFSRLRRDLLDPHFVADFLGHREGPGLVFCGKNRAPVRRLKDADHVGCQRLVGHLAGLGK